MASSRVRPGALAGSIVNDRRTFSIFHCWSRSSRRMTMERSEHMFVTQAACSRSAAAGAEGVGGGLADEVDAGAAMAGEGEDDRVGFLVGGEVRQRHTVADRGQGARVAELHLGPGGADRPVGELVCGRLDDLAGLDGPAGGG